MKKLLYIILLFIGFSSYAQKRTFVYDELQRLKVVNYWNGDEIVSSVEYFYDAVGNRLRKEISGQCPAPTAAISGSHSINEGQSATLSVTLTGAAPWTVVVNGQTYSNILSSPHQISVSPSATTTYTISSVTNKCGLGTVSGSATIAVCQFPSATINGTQSIIAGQTANLSVALTGSAPWTITVNGQTYSNITTSPKVIAVSPSTTTTYTVSSVSNSCGTGTVNGSAVITICNPATAVISGSQTITQGQSANISVALTGTPPWNLVVNGQSYTNIATSPKVIPVSPNTTTTYTISSVTNSCGAGTVSGTATVNVCVPATAAISGTNTINQGQNATLAINLGGNSPWSFKVNGQQYSNISVNPYLITVSPTSTTTYTVSDLTNSCGTGTSTGSAIITVNVPTGCDPYENNNTIATATLITGTSFNSPDLCIDDRFDKDYFKWVNAGKTYYFLVQTYANATTGKYKVAFNFNGSQLQFELLPTKTGENTDTFLTMYDSDGTTILAENDDIGGTPWSYYSKVGYFMPIVCNDKPDLAIIDIPITEYKSNQLKYTVQIKNQGGISADLSSVAFYSYTSPDAVYNNNNDRFINGIFIGGNLAAGQVLNFNWQGEFKYDANYYLIGVIDYHSLLAECSETNNTFVKLANACTDKNLNLASQLSGYYSTNGYVQISDAATTSGNVLVVGKSILGLPNFSGSNITLQTGQCLESNTVANPSGSGFTEESANNPPSKKEIHPKRNTPVLYVEEEIDGWYAVFELAVPQKVSIEVWSSKDKKLISSLITDREYEPGVFREKLNSYTWKSGEEYLIHLVKPSNRDVTLIRW